ncbi:MAG: hypothetical protein WA817_13730 [Candidatus Acidiferrum sp.]
MIWKLEGILAIGMGFIRLERFSSYLAQEALIVLMLTAVMLVTVLIVAMAFILFSTGARIGFVWLNAKIKWIACSGNEQIARGDSTAALPPRRE